MDLPLCLLFLRYILDLTWRQVIDLFTLEFSLERNKFTFHG
jgi:hypothetical protein